MMYTTQIRLVFVQRGAIICITAIQCSLFRSYCNYLALLVANNIVGIVLVAFDCHFLAMFITL